MDVVPPAAEGEEEAPAGDLVVHAEQVPARLWHMQAVWKVIDMACLRP